MPSQGRPRLEDSLAVRATRRANERRSSTVTPKTKTKTTDLAAMSDDDLAHDLRIATRIINVGLKDRHHGRVTAEEGHRRLGKARANIAERVEAGASAIVHDLGRAEGTVHIDSLTRFAALHHLASSAAAWECLATTIDAPTPSDQGPIWALATDAERVAERAEMVRVLADANVRVSELLVEVERRRAVDEDAHEAERIARYRARQGVS